MTDERPPFPSTLYGQDPVWHEYNYGTWLAAYAHGDLPAINGYVMVPEGVSVVTGGISCHGGITFDAYHLGHRWIGFHTLGPADVWDEDYLANELGLDYSHADPSIALAMYVMGLFGAEPTPLDEVREWRLEDVIDECRSIAFQIKMRQEVY